MKVSVLQPDLRWEDKKANLARLEKMLDTLPDGTAMVVLPEMFTTAFTMNPELLAETMEGPTVQWMLHHATERNCAVCGTIIVEDNGLYYNRMIFVTPEGRITFYDKRHLHSMSGEEKVYTPGRKQVFCDWSGFSMNLQVCYDLRFPVWSRNRGKTDVIIYSANWPRVRSFAWKSLLVARAIENQCYVVASNRIGTNPDGTSYSGDSLIIGPKGDTLASLPVDTEGIISADLSKEALERYRADMPVWRDADDFTINILG